jgi:hypothetical protein
MASCLSRLAEPTTDPAMLPFYEKQAEPIPKYAFMSCLSVSPIFSQKPLATGKQLSHLLFIGRQSGPVFTAWPLRQARFRTLLQKENDNACL